MKRAILAVLLIGARAGAWEAETTDAGLTEQAALSSKVHLRLVSSYGRRLGWYDTLTVKRDEAYALYKKLAALEPASGVVPDVRGRQTILAWLIAGTILEALPPERQRNHFYDPVHKTGLTGRGTHGMSSFDAKIWGSLSGEGLVENGIAAPDWIVSKDNDLGLRRFWDELVRAGTSAEPAERDLHLALAMICAGAMMHVLEDVGAPAHARDDLRDHLQLLGAGQADRGSRYERLAALIYSRLGVPAPGKQVPHPAHLRDLFTATDGSGLADLTAARWFSSGTLPGEIDVPLEPRPNEVTGEVAHTLTFPAPKPTGELHLKAAEDAPVALRDDNGVCLAQYRQLHRRLSWQIDDTCAAEQLAVILPGVGAYAQGLLEWLFRGQLSVSVTADSVRVTVAEGAPALGAGKIYLVGEDSKGKRWGLGEIAATGGNAGDELGSLSVGETTMRKVIAVYRGVDAAGEELVAVGETSASE
jgi:hypothetical protein